MQEDSATATTATCVNTYLIERNPGIVSVAWLVEDSLENLENPKRHATFKSAAVNLYYMKNIRTNYKLYLYH